MSKIFNYYSNDIDRTWYNSSNIIYSECDDKTNELKVVRITFKNGRTYEYKDVKVNDYLMFRESQSQGKAFNQFMKSYETTKIADVNVDDLMEELDRLQNPEGVSVEISTNEINIYENKELKYNSKINEETSDIIAQVLSVLDVKFKIIKEDDSN